MLDFDQLLFQVGEFGRYQKALFLFQAPFCIFVTFVLFGQVFMTLYPFTIWCGDHFNCTTGSMTSFQRQNLSFSFRPGRLGSLGAVDHCLMNHIDTSFVMTVVNSIREREGDCGSGACNYSHPNVLQAPEAFYGGSSWGASRGRGPNPQYGYDYYRTTTTPEEEEDAPYWWGTPSTTTTGRPPPKGNVPGAGRTRRPPPQTSLGTTTTTTEEATHTTRPPLSSSTKAPTSQSAPLFEDGIPLRFSSNKTCSLWVPEGPFNLTLVNRSRIVLPLLLPAQIVSGDRVLGIDAVPPFVSYRRPAYVPTSHCRTINWTGAPPYPTIVTEGGWWCRAELYTTAAQAVFFLGAIVGGFLIGWIADNYGRVPALVIANLFGALGGGLSVLTTNIWLFMLFRFITGMAFDNCFTMMYILVLEFCGPTYRTLVANLSIAVFYTTGTLLLPLLARWIGDWKIYGAVISLPMLLGLAAIFLVPESARWLLSKGRTREATDILRSFAKVNGRKVDERIFVEFESDAKKIYDEMQADEEDSSFTAALKTPRLRRTFILLTLIWSLIAVVYDGHSRNILNLSDENWDVFWMFGIASLTEFPADMLLIFTLDRFGRRWLSFGALTLSGASSIIAATIPPEMRTVSLIMAITSRFFVNVAFNIGLQYAAELLPTVIRAQGVNAIHIMGYVASILSPFVVAIGRTSPALSLIILGVAATAGGFLSLMLAETLGEDLPNTLEEAEAFGLNQSFWNCPICAKEKDDYEGLEDSPPKPEVMLRNHLRAGLRGESFRSSIISGGSSSGGGGSRGSRVSRFPNVVAMSPIPASSRTDDETAKLRRVTH